MKLGELGIRWYIEMSQKSLGKEKSPSEVTGKVVLVAVKASKEIPRAALVWALTHVVQPGDTIKLSVVLPAFSSGIMGFARITTDCTISHSRSFAGTVSDQKEYIADSCSQLVLGLRELYDPEKVKIRVKVISGSSCGVVAAEAKRVHASWVILDKKLKQEKKACMEELQCNVVLMKRSQPKFLQLNLTNSTYLEAKEGHCMFPESGSCQSVTGKYENRETIKGPSVTPAGSPDQGSPITLTDIGTSSISSSDPGMSPFFSATIAVSLSKDFKFLNEVNRNMETCDSDSESDNVSTCSGSSYFEPWTVNKVSMDTETPTCEDGVTEKFYNKDFSSSYETFSKKLWKLNQQQGMKISNYRIVGDITRSVREAVSLVRHAPSGPPPLCSICQHKAPVFGSPPKWFTFAELEHATQGFSQVNFLAEGGFGSVHRGVLPGGLVIAVKQYKLASSQGDIEFCSEVEILSCAQHRNVVMLIGFCVEEGRRLLVYEYICNGSLDSHLYGRRNPPLEWSARQKIAVGAARGLRYLHEECRVGCIVHRDMRPNNILLTHDFEPLVGDFGLARWQPDGHEGVETRVLGTFGYLAPEYAQSGQITEKADVYSFGVVLLELVTGRKAIDLKRPRGQQSLTEWARPLLEKHAIHELLDPHLRNSYGEQEILDMLKCSALCIRQDLHLRPRMSQVLRMLEGDRFI